MKTRRTDVLVIGSGFGAAAPALRLAESGLKVTMIEKGPNVGPGLYRQTQDPKYLMKYLKGLGSEHLDLVYAEALGGGSGFYEMVSLRTPTVAFDQRDGDGWRLWPSGIDREALDPYYDRAEAMLRVEQIRPEDVPRSGQVFALMMSRLGYSCDRARYAVRNCLGSGYCVTGCIYGAKQSLHVNYLPQAAAAGAEIVCDAEALSIHALPTAPAGSGRRGGRPAPRYVVRCRVGGDRGQLVEYHAGIVVLGGGTVGSALLLLASRAGLPHLSDQVGRNIAFNGSVKAAGILPDDLPDGDMYAGRSHPGMISYEFLESHGITISAAKPLPVPMIATARLRQPDLPAATAWWGAANVELMRQVRHRVIILFTMGLTPPVGHLTVDAGGTPHLAVSNLPALTRYERETEAILHTILTRNGCRPLAVDAVDRMGAPQPATSFSTAHQTGSCRMSDSPRTGVVDPHGEVHGHPGLFVSDGAAIPTSLAVNTSLTILANAERIADGIVARYGLTAAAH
jgi:choline dehydrogenase-like flavoprotein